MERTNVIIFGADMSFSSHERNRQNEIYVLGKDFTQGVTTVGPTTLSGKTSKEQQSMPKNCTKTILQSQRKSLYFLYITTAIMEMKT